MGEFLVQFLVFILLFTLLTYFAGRFISRYVQRHITGRLEAIDQIVNRETVPEAWLRPYRARAARLVAAGATDRQIRALSGIARKRCLANIQDLIRYAGGFGLSDNETTKRYMLEELKRQELRWQNEAEWHTLVDLTKPSKSAETTTTPDVDEPAS